MSLTPTLFTSARSDGPNPASLQPSHWNAVTALLTALLGTSGATGGLLMRDSTSNYGASWVEPGTGILAASGGMPSWTMTPTLTSLAFAAGSGAALSRSFASDGTLSRFWSLSSGLSGRGPFAAELYTPLFNGERDPSMYIGYNQTAGGTPITSSENGFAWGLEGDYNDGSGANKMESYWQYVSADGLTTNRPLFVSMNRTTNKAHLVSLKSNAIKFIADDGTAAEGGASMYWFLPNTMTMFASDSTADTVLALKAAATKTAKISLGFQGIDDYMFMQPEAANAAFIYLNTRRVLAMYSTPNGSAGAAIAVGALENGAAGTFAVSLASQKGLVARGFGSQTAALQEWQDVNSNVLSRVNKDGYYMTAKNSIPADAALNSGELAFWFDSTNGAAKLMVKAKSANGTVATGSLALT